MLFLIPAGVLAFKAAAAATAAITTAKVATTVVIVGGGVLIGKGLYEAGRLEGLAEGKGSLAVDNQAQRDSFHGMETAP